MSISVNFKAVYVPSNNVVAREIEGEIIIVPLVAGVGDFEEELFTLNETGRIIWNSIDGKKTLENIATDLQEQFDVDQVEMKQDILGFVTQLLERQMLDELD